MGLAVYFSLAVKILLAVADALYRKIIPPLMKSIDGEIVLVTGAGHGMGRTLAIEFVKRGATLVVIDINEENNEETAEQIRKTGGKVYAYTCDLGKRESIKKICVEIREEAGNVSILVNNAGMINYANVTSLAEEKIEKLINVNLVSHFWMIKEFLPAMKRKNHGHIVAMASRAGLSALPFAADYSASKFACVGLCEALSRELRQQKLCGIHVTCICPGFVDTGLVRNLHTGSGPVKMLKAEFVVDQVIKGVLRNESLICIPKLTMFERLSRALLPTQAKELLFDFRDLNYDLIDVSKTY